VSSWLKGARTTGWWLAAACGIGLLAADVAGQLQRGVAEGRTAFFWLTMTVGMLVGLWAWAWRAPSRIGKLMFWWPALLVAADLPNAYPDSSLVSTIGLGTLVFGYIVFAQMALSYPTGRLLPGRLAWVYVFILGYLAQGIQNVVNMLYWDASGCAVCPAPHAPTLIHVGSPPFSLETWNNAWFVFIMAILPIGLYVLYRAYAEASIGARRSIGPVVATATFITCASWVYFYFILTDNYSALSPLSWVLTTGALVGALTALFGLAVTRRVRGSVGDLVVELDRAGPGGVRRALARAMGDPTLELALWLPERRAWVDDSGREVMLPTRGDQTVTLVGDDLAAIIHDPVLLSQPELLEAVGTAARVALENERLQAELRLQLGELRESRARIVRAGDEERRRLERDLHDGAQQRLLGIGMALQLLRSRAEGNGPATDLLDETELEVQSALRELRELARGIHPVILSEAGLGPALASLAERSPIPVTVAVAPSDRFPARVEETAYYVASEALTNAAKHAHASAVTISTRRLGGGLVVEIGDDGVGGADPNGSGLRGLADRVAALDGRLQVRSPTGEGTCVIAELPCGS
jgi:signal transduction histidine kinase